MRKLIFTLIFLLIFPALVSAQDWDTFDKILMGSVISCQIVDCLQTIEIYENDNYYEKYNLFIEKGVTKFGKSFIPIYFATTTTAIYIFSNELLSPYRKAGLGLVLGSSLFMIGNNASIGIGFSIPF